MTSEDKKSSYGCLTIIAIVVIVWSVISLSSKTDNKKSDTTDNAAQQVAAPKNYTIGEELTVGNFSYKVKSIYYTDDIGDYYYGKQADGIYLIVNLSFRNNDNVEHDLSENLFKLYDPEKNEYECDKEASMFLGNKMIFMKGCNPHIVKSGSIVFEVPKKSLYTIGLSGGYSNSDISYVTLY